MKIIIAGAGEVGFYLAKLLTQERQEIVIIDLDQERLNYVSTHLDVHTVRGSSTSFKFLEAANVSKADLLISVTSSEETNLTTCIIAKKLGAKNRTQAALIARENRIVLKEPESKNKSQNV